MRIGVKPFRDPEKGKFAVGLNMFRQICAAAALVAMTGAAAAQSTLVACTEGSPDNLNPQFSGSNTTYDYAQQVYDRLVANEIGGSKLIPALAESWENSADGLTWTLHLRRGVKWHSNRHFTPTRDFNADDVIYTFDRMGNPDHPYHRIGGTGYGMYDNALKTRLDRIEKVDDYTVRFVLKVPIAAFLATLTVEPMSIMSAEYGQKMLAAKTPDLYNQQPIGTGAFQFVAFQRDSFVRFRAFPQHWAKQAGLTDRTAQVDNLVFAITPDPSVRLAKLRAGECHIARYPNPADLETIKADPNLTTLEVSGADYGFLAVNQAKKPFDDIRVRQAIEHAINYDALIDAVYRGTGRRAAALIPPALWGHNPDLKPRAYDPARAKALLAEAGLADGFSTTLWALPVTRGYMPNGRRAAEMIQADLAAVGIRASITTFEWGEYLRRARQGEHEIAMAGYIYDYPDPSQIILSGWTCAAVESGGNRAHWCNKEFNDLIEQANATSDQAKRAELYIRAQKIAYDDAATFLIANSSTFTPIRKEVVGYRVHVFGGQPFVGVSLRR